MFIRTVTMIFEILSRGTCSVVVCWNDDVSNE